MGANDSLNAFIDKVFEEFDDLYRNGQFDEADRRLVNVNVDALDSYGIVTYLNVAFWPEAAEGRILPSRLPLIERSIRRLRDLGMTEDVIESLVKGFRPGETKR